MLTQVLLLLAVVVIAVAVCRRAGLPPVLGYLFAGMALGPHALGWLHESEPIRLLGELGVAFLLFAIGLEFSLPQLWAMRRTLFGLGSAQVLMGTASGGLIAWWLGISWQASIVVGGALAMSSTAIVVKQMTDQLELQTPHGRLALGILLFQDLAAVPFLVMIPILAVGALDAVGVSLLLALVKAVVAFAVMLAVGRWALRPLFHEVSSARSPELFTLTVLLVSLLAAWLTSLLGLSLVLGAFLAGMMLSETEYRHQIEADIRPFRDILLGLFFVTVGMQLDLLLLPPLWAWIILLILGLVLGKGLLIMVLTRLSGISTIVSIRTGVVLAHGGEFGLALLSLALGTGLLRVSESQPILAAIVVSMILAPLLIRHSEQIVLRWRRRAPLADAQVDEIASELAETLGHVLICGYGRVGQSIAACLKAEQIEFVALDRNPQRIKQAWEDGDRVFFGDAGQLALLLAAGLERARALVIVVDEIDSAARILRCVDALSLHLPVLVRTHDAADLMSLSRYRNFELIADTLEASLALSARLLALLEVPAEDIEQRIETSREQIYRAAVGTSPK